MLNNKEVAEKVEWEGLEYAITGYFGRDPDFEDVELRAVWRVAYDALTQLQTMLDAGMEVTE